MCCDGRRTVRQTAITYLQRALLAHELQVLTAGEWLACFQEVIGSGGGERGNISPSGSNSPPKICIQVLVV